MKRVNTVISLVSGGLVLFLAGSAFLLSFDALQSLAVTASIYVNELQEYIEADTRDIVW